MTAAVAANVHQRPSCFVSKSCTTPMPRSASFHMQQTQVLRQVAPTLANQRSVAMEAKKSDVDSREDEIRKKVSCAYIILI